METVAQKVIPLKLPKPGKVFIYSQAQANLRETGEDDRMLIAACLLTGISLLPENKGGKDFETVSVLSITSHLINDRHRVILSLFCFQFFCLSCLPTGYLNIFQDSVLIYLQCFSISLCIVFSVVALSITIYNTASTQVLVLPHFLNITVFYIHLAKSSAFFLFICCSFYHFKLEIEFI